jgi:hypothetical protein
MTDTSNAGTDTGYTFHGPKIVDRRMPLKNGLILEANHLSGVVVSENPDSPMHHATLFAQGTTVVNAAGAILGSACLWEFTDPDGDSAWAIGLTWPADWLYGPGVLRLVQGTGKWEDIAGTFSPLGVMRERADDHRMLRWEAWWEVDRERTWDYEALVQAGAYTDHDTGYSFHGPHVVTGTVELANGLVLVANNQSGVLISENPNSPRHNATCYDRGSTIKTPEGKALGDIMLLEDTDADGDVVWLYHEWWYGQGPGRYQFLGGTGKWTGIVGVGKTLGMVCSRADDHFMPTWEMHWRIAAANPDAAGPGSWPG